MRYILLPVLVLYGLFGQAQRLLSESEAVEATLRHSAAARAAQLSIRKNGQLLKSTVNVPNLDLIVESPTGSFYTLGITQTFEFPTVYTRQKSVQQGQVLLAEKEQDITESNLRLRAKQVYLNAQAAQNPLTQLLAQDSLYAQIQLAAVRQFEAGQIDKLAVNFAELQYGEIHNQLQQVQAAYQTAVKILQTLTGTNEDLTVNPLERAVVVMPLADTMAIANQPLLSAFRQLEQISQSQTKVEQAKALPGFVLGYFNQSTRETPTSLRFRVGLTLPLWFGQYKSRIAAAQTGEQLAHERTLAQQQSLYNELQQAVGEYTRWQQAAAYYEQSGLQKAAELLTNARRFFENGQSDYVSFLRTANDVYLVRQRFTEAVQGHNQAILNIQFLTGNL